MRLSTSLELRPEITERQTRLQSNQESAAHETAQAEGSALVHRHQGGGGDWTSSAIFFGGMILLFWFLLIAPERRRRREHQERLASLKEKDQIVTMGGIHGTIVSLDQETITIRIDDKRGTTMKISRQAVAQTRGESEEKS